MGWWSKDIMGGDSPLDLECVIYEALDVPFDTPLPNEVDLELLLKKVKENDPYWIQGEESYLLYQVLGVLMMKYGCPIPEHLKNEMIVAAKNDEWAKEDQERKEVMNNFINILEQYDGKPIKITSKGLFEVMAEKLGVSGFESNKQLVATKLEELLSAMDVFTKDVSPKHWRRTGHWFTELKKMKSDLDEWTEITDEERENVKKYEN